MNKLIIIIITWLTLLTVSDYYGRQIVTEQIEISGMIVETQTCILETQNLILEFLSQ